MNPIDKLNIYKDSFTKSERLVYDYIMKNPNTIIRNTIDSLAERTDTSKSAIMRLCKKMGYQGFSEFKFELSRYIISMEKDYETDKPDPIAKIANEYSKHILALRQHVEPNQLKKIVQLFKKAKRVKVMGNNRTGLSAQQFRYRVAQLGFDCEAIVDSVLMINQEGILTKGDLCIIFTITGLSHVYEQLTANCKEKGCDVIIFTMNPHCPLSTYAKEMIYLPYISRSSYDSFLDDQAIFFVFIELFLSELATQSK
ncbi:MAG: MurR/RpiR family transcriptional regulator [Beduini sp.]|uniref:MurR/RpiR family transcriptional regulator n=1 Tax=Beduini sp. TaxID=1922300 RepID=UPI0039A3BFE8